MFNQFVDGCRSLLVGKSRSSVYSATEEYDRGALFAFSGSLSRLTFNGRKKAQFCHVLAEAVPFLVEEFRGTTGRAEKHFLKLGADLQAIYGKSSELAQQIVGAISSIDTADGTGMLQELKGLVSNGLANLASCREEATGKERIIRKIAAVTGGLDRHCSEAERVGTFLTVVGVNIRIESAQKEEFDSLFGIIAEKIKQSSDRISEIIEQIRSDAASLYLDQLKASRSIAEDLSELGSLTEEADQLVNQAFGQIEELINLACLELGRAGQHSTTLTSRVGEIVMGIQLHDSINQRIEHIIEALEELESTIHDGKTAAQPADLLEILNLQQGQLLSMVEEVEAVYSRTRAALGSIGRCVEDLNGSLAGFAQGSESGRRDPFGRLTGALLQLDRLLGTGAGLIADIDASAENTAQAAGRLSGNLEQIQDIGFQTRLIGLNSIVNAARLGQQGRTFEVLSNHLAGMAAHAESFVGTMESIVEAIRGHIEETKQQSGCRAGVSERDLSIAAVVEKCSSRYERFRQMSAAAGSLAETVRLDLVRVDSELDFLDRLRQELLEMSERCDELARPLQAWAGDARKRTGKYRQELAKRYTMQQERDIHESILSLPAAATASTVGETSQQDDGVLFFDAGLQARPRMSAAVGSQSGEVTKAEDDKVLFDDNVELF